MDLKPRGHIVERTFEQADLIVPGHLESEIKIVICDFSDSIDEAPYRFFEKMIHHEPEGGYAHQNGGEYHENDVDIPVGNESIDRSQGIVRLEKTKNRSRRRIGMAIRYHAAFFVDDRSDNG
ncbi:MAG: hypothetical protein ACYTG7_01260 [Planctomycetota bacterium]